MNIQFLHCQNPPFLRHNHCNFCLNLHITHGDMKENVGVFSEHSVKYQADHIGEIPTESISMVEGR